MPLRIISAFLLALGLVLPMARGADGRPALLRLPQTTAYVSSTAVDASGHIYVCGGTSSPELLPALTRRFGALATNKSHAFILKLRPNGEVVAGVLLGGSGNDYVNQIAVDARGNVVVVGTTYSADFPKAKPLPGASATIPDLFVCKLDAGLTRLQFSRYLSAGNYTRAEALVIGQDGGIFLGGLTYSKSFPTPIESSAAYTYDGFIVKLAADGGEIGFAKRLGSDA